MNPGPFLSPGEAARFLGVTTKALKEWRRPRSPLGPPFVRMSQRTVRYSTEDLKRYLRERTEKK